MWYDGPAQTGEMVTVATGLDGSARKNLDEKDRVGLLSHHVAELTGEVVLVPGAAPCVEIHPLPSWNRYRKHLSAAADRGPAEANFARHVLGNAQHVRLDGQGRVRIEDELLRWIGVAVKPTDGPREVLMMGMGTRVELWSPAKWEEQRRQFEASFETTRASLFEGSAPQQGTDDADEDEG